MRYVHLRWNSCTVVNIEHRLEYILYRLLYIYFLSYHSYTFYIISQNMFTFSTTLSCLSRGTTTPMASWLRKKVRTDYFLVDFSMSSRGSKQPHFFSDWPTTVPLSSWFSLPMFSISRLMLYLSVLVMSIVFWGCFQSPGCCFRYSPCLKNTEQHTFHIEDSNFISIKMQPKH